MNKLCPFVLAAIVVLASGCAYDLGDPAWVKKSVKRSQYVLLCDTDSSGDYLEFRYVKPLHVRSGVSVPFRPSDSLGHFGTKIEDDAIYPDRAAVFYEKTHRTVKMTSILSIYNSSVPSSIYRVSDLENALKNQIDEQDAVVE